MELDHARLCDAIGAAVEHVLKHTHKHTQQAPSRRRSRGPGGRGAPDEARAALHGMLRPTILALAQRARMEDLQRVLVAHGAAPEGACLARAAGARAAPRPRPLGRGAQGSVFELDAERAVKLVRLDRPHRPWERAPPELFRTEVEMMRRAAGAGVGPRLHEHYVCCEGRAGRCHGVIVMERVRGEVLSDWERRVGRGQAQAQARAAVRAKLQAAIARLHAAGVYHNDLHPRNVMVTPQGDVRIIDYGLASGQPGQPGPDNPRQQRQKRHPDFEVLDRLHGSSGAPSTVSASADDGRFVEAVIERLLEAGAVRLEARPHGATSRKSRSTAG